MRNPRHLDLQVDAIEQRPGKPGPVALDHGRRAAATVLGIALVTAGTGIHRCHQHERRRIGQALRCATDADLAILERLPQHLQDILLELGQFIEEQHPVVSQRHLARPGMSAAADQAGIGDGVVRRAEHPPGDQRLTGGEQTEDRVDLGDFEGFLEGLRRQDRRNAAGQHGLAAAGRSDHQDVVPTGRGDFESPLDMPLAAHFGEINLIPGSIADQRGNG